MAIHHNLEEFQERCLFYEIMRVGELLKLVFFSYKKEWEGYLDRYPLLLF